MADAADASIVRIKKWMRKSSIAFFERAQDVVGAIGYVKLSHPIVISAMASGFEVISRDTHFVTCRARYILSNNLKATVYKESEVFGAETAIDQMFEQIHDYFDTRIEQGEQKLLSIGFAPTEIQRATKNYETKTVTNSVTQYVDILHKADYYLAIVNYLWIMGELSDSQDEARKVKLTIEHEVRDNLFTVARTTTLHYNNIRRLCNAVIEKRRQEREEQSRRDRERAAKKIVDAAARERANEERKAVARERRNAEREMNLATAQGDQDAMAAPAPV